MKRIAQLVVLSVMVAAALAEQRVRGPLVLSDRWPECTTLQTWVEDIFRIDGVTEASERDRAISLFHWLRLFNRLSEGVGGMAHAIEGPWGEEVFVRDAHKHLFVYGWGHCATHSLIAEALWQEYTGDPLSADRVIVMHEDGSYHTMYRLRLDGFFGAFDARYAYYLLERDAPDARILDWDGVGDDRNIYANLEFENRSRPFFEFPEKEFARALWVKPKKVFESEAAWRAAGTEPEVVFRDRHYRMGTRFHDMRFELLRGMTIERHWDNRMRKWYLPKKNEDMFLSEGRFYRVGASMVGADGLKSDPNFEYALPYMTQVPKGQGYPRYLEGDLSLGQAWGMTQYRPDLGRGDLEQAELWSEGLTRRQEAPFLRPSASAADGEMVVEFYSPYVLVEGLLRGSLAGTPEDLVEVAFRSQVPKPQDLSEEDRWLPWTVIASKPGPFQVTLDRVDLAEGRSSFHGAYRFQVRFRFRAGTDPEEVGLDEFQWSAYFETGIMAIPQIFPGENTVRFKVADSTLIDSDILVDYRWETTSGEENSHIQRIHPALFFKNNEAVFRVWAPELKRCRSLTISYP